MAGEMDELERLVALYQACHQVLPTLDEKADGRELAEAIRKACRLLEVRLRELGALPEWLAQAE